MPEGRWPRGVNPRPRSGAAAGRSYPTPLSPRPRAAAGRSNRTTEARGGGQEDHGLYSPLNSPGQNTGVGCHSRLQGIFPTQGLNPGLPSCMWILYQLSHKGNPLVILAVANKTTLQKIKQKFYYKK